MNVRLRFRRELGTLYTQPDGATPRSAPRLLRTQPQPPHQLSELLNIGNGSHLRIGVCNHPRRMKCFEEGVFIRDIHDYRHSPPCQAEVHAKRLKGLPLLDEALHLFHIPLDFSAGFRVYLSLNDVLHDCLLDRIWAEGITAFAFDATLELGEQDAEEQAFAAHNEEHPDEPIRVRIGLHTGQAIKEGEDVFGKSVILAARIASQAQEQILVSSLLKALVESSGEFEFGDVRDVELKGLAGQHQLYQASWKTGG